MNDLLYLTHRIPYPPNKGDKIRSYHLLRGMAERWNVHLGTFIDDPDDWQHTSALEKICGETNFIGLNPATARFRALKGLLTGSSLTMPYYASAKMSRWVRDLAEQKKIDLVVAYSSSMAQYALPLLGSNTRAIVDFCDMDSDKWRQYSDKFSGLKRWIYAREAEKLRGEETAIADRFDASVLISDDEAAIFCKQTGIAAAKVHTVRNGVDTAFFDPGLDYVDPYSGDSKVVVFVGAMDYWPNIDAVGWFAKEIFPGVRAKSPGAEFYVVGSNPGRDVKDLQKIAGVTVTGKVEDVRPYLHYARCVAAPLRVARGVQNKVLEAMAMARPVAATSMALEGISYDAESGIRLCDSVPSWIDQLTAVLGDEARDISEPGARRHVSKVFSWEASSRSLAKVITGS